jgi:hypothetical protein
MLFSKIWSIGNSSTIARTSGKPVAAVWKLFAEEGTSFSDYVTRERLAYVHARLVIGSTIFDRLQPSHTTSALPSH